MSEQGFEPDCPWAYGRNLFTNKEGYIRGDTLYEVKDDKTRILFSCDTFQPEKRYAVVSGDKLVRHNIFACAESKAALETKLKASNSQKLRGIKKVVRRSLGDKVLDVMNYICKEETDEAKKIKAKGVQDTRNAMKEAKAEIRNKLQKRRFNAGERDHQNVNSKRQRGSSQRADKAPSSVQSKVSKAANFKDDGIGSRGSKESSSHSQFLFGGGAITSTPIEAHKSKSKSKPKLSSETEPNNGSEASSVPPKVLEMDCDQFKSNPSKNECNNGSEASSVPSKVHKMDSDQSKSNHKPSFKNKPNNGSGASSVPPKVHEMDSHQSKSNHKPSFKNKPNNGSGTSISVPAPKVHEMECDQECKCSDAISLKMALTELESMRHQYDSKVQENRFLQQNVTKSLATLENKIDTLDERMSKIESNASGRSLSNMKSKSTCNLQTLKYASEEDKRKGDVPVPEGKVYIGKISGTEQFVNLKDLGKIDRKNKSLRIRIAHVAKLLWPKTWMHYSHTGKEGDGLKIVESHEIAVQGLLRALDWSKNKDVDLSLENIHREIGKAISWLRKSESKTKSGTSNDGKSADVGNEQDLRAKSPPQLPDINHNNNVSQISVKPEALDDSEKNSDNESENAQDNESENAQDNESENAQDNESENALDNVSVNALDLSSISFQSQVLNVVDRAEFSPLLFTELTAQLAQQKHVEQEDDYDSDATDFPGHEEEENK